MLLAPPNTVLLLARLLNFIHHNVLSAGSDLKTILVVYDNLSTQITNDIMCSSRMQSLNVGWSTLNVDVLAHEKMFPDRLPLTLAILQHDIENTLVYGLRSLDTEQFKTHYIILICPFEISELLLQEFEFIYKYLPILLAYFIDDTIKVIFRSKLLDRPIFVDDLQFESDIQNLFYRPFYNLQSQQIDVVTERDPPITFNTIRIQVTSGSGKINDVSGAELYLMQLIAECLNGTAIFHIRIDENSDEMRDRPPEWSDYVINKQQLPLQAPALPKIKNVDYISVDEYLRKPYKREVRINNKQMLEGTLYPHTEMEYVIVLPNIVTVRSILLSSMVRNPLFTVWAFIVTLVTVIRKLLQRFAVKVTRRSFSELVFDSFGRAFGTSMISEVPIRSERILLLAMSVVAILAGIFCSGALIEQFSINHYTQVIRNVEDLKTSGYKIFFPNEIAYNLRQYFHNNFFKNNSVESIERNHIYMYIWREMHPDKYFAYVIPANVCLWLGLYSAEGRKRYYILQPPFLRIQSRLNVREERFQEAVEAHVVRVVEHGFVAHYNKQFRNALVQEFGNIDDSAEDNASFKPGTIADLYFMFSCIGIGLSISCMAFAGELLFNKYNSKLRFKRFKWDGAGKNKGNIVIVRSRNQERLSSKQCCQT